MAISVKSELRRRILDVTRTLLVERGVNQVSVRLIASAVGCSVGTIYTYFDNKDVLIHSLIEEGFERLVESQQSIAAAVVNPLERLKALCRNYIRYGLQNPEYYEIMYHLNPDRMSRYPAEKYRRARKSLEIIADTLQECTDARLMNVHDPYIGAHIIWSMLHGLVTLIQFQRIDKKIDQDQFINYLIDQSASITTA